MMRYRSRSRGRRRGKIGCLAWCVALVMGAAILGKLGADGRDRTGPAAAPVGPAPAAAAAPVVGDPVIVEVPGNRRIWLASEDAWGEMLDAQNAGSAELMARLVERGKVIVAPNGSRGVLVKGAMLSCLVRLTDGALAGREGWIQREFVRLAAGAAAAPVTADDGEAMRREIYNARWQAGMWAHRQAEARFPSSALADHGDDAGWLARYEAARHEFYLERKGAARDVVAEHYGVSSDDFEAIENEGHSKKWEVAESPVLFDPSRVKPEPRPKASPRKRRGVR